MVLTLRAELEVARIERAAERRERTAVLASIAAAAFSLCLALAFGSWAVVHALAGALDLWGAAGLATLLWASVAAWLLHVRGGLAFLRHLAAADADADTFAAAELRLRAAEEDVTKTARRLATVLAVETAEGIAGRIATVAERDAQAALHELVTLLTAPGRAGLSALERMLARGPNGRP